MFDVTMLINFCVSFLKLNNKTHSNKHFMARYCAFIFLFPSPINALFPSFFPLISVFFQCAKKSDHWSCSLLLLKVHSNIGTVSASIQPHSWIEPHPLSFNAKNYSLSVFYVVIWGQKSILKNRTPGLYWSRYGISYLFGN